MIEKLILKHINGEKLQGKELKAIDDAFITDPSLIDQYRDIKRFFNDKTQDYINDSIFIYKRIKRIFSTIEIETIDFIDQKVASVKDNNIFFNLLFKWNGLDLSLFSEIYSTKINIKAVSSDKEISFKNSKKELFHLILSSNQVFTYTFNDSNIILTSENKNFAIFIR